MTDLVVDIGNTRMKAAHFTAGRLVRRAVMAHGDTAALGALLHPGTPSRIVVGSVAASDTHLLDHLRTLAPVLTVTGGTPVPLRSGYATPLTLGADRLANAVGGWRMFPGRPVLVIDLGTCITYDLVEADGTHAGGAISPGMRLRAKAMAEHSAQLPLVDPPTDAKALGTSTRESLSAGIQHGILAELKAFQATYGHERPELAVVLTGGDALRFSRALKSGIFAHPFLTLYGLHAILDHHHALYGFPRDPDGHERPRTGSAG